MTPHPSVLSQALVILTTGVAIVLIGQSVQRMVPAPYQARTSSASVIPTPTGITKPIITLSSQDAQTGKWSRLSSLQRTVLAPLLGEWAFMQPAQRQKWLEVAARFPRMSSLEQHRIQERMLEWTRLKPAERGFARLNFQGMQKLSPRERQRLWQAYLDLTPQEREDLAKRVQAGDKINLRALPRKSLSQTASKSNILARQQSINKALTVSPTKVQPGIGATTIFMNQLDSKTPSHQIIGAPKILASSSYVNPTTLLPPSQ